MQVRAAKCWQGEDPIMVWQIHIPLEWQEVCESKKAFLIADTRADAKSLQLSLKKPDRLNPAGIMVNAVRKRCGKSMGITIYQSAKNFLLRLMSKEGQWAIWLESARPNVLHLLDPEKEASLYRLSQGASYTKPKTLENHPWKDPSYKKIDDSALWQELSATKNSESVPDSTEKSSHEADDSPLPAYQKMLRQSLKRRLRTLKKTLSKSETSLPKPEALEELKHHAHLLQSFGHLVKKDDHQLDLDAATCGTDTVIPLDPERSLGQNIEEKFKQLKKLQKRRVHLTKQITETQQALDDINLAIQQLEQGPISFQDQLDIRNRFKLRVSPPSAGARTNAVASPYLVFLSSLGHRILVGKGPRENDLLTKSAQSNDYWLHTISVTGSHVIVPKEGDLRRIDSLPSSTQKEAAILAIHFSKLRGDQAGEVYFTSKAHLRKDKGLPAGLWKVNRSETLFFRYDQSQLKDVLDRKQTVES